MKCSLLHWIIFFSLVHTVIANGMPCKPSRNNVKNSIPTHASLYNRNGILIFLDESENTHLGFVTDSFLKAVLQKAGPIIVSASVIINARDSSPVKEKDP